MENKSRHRKDDRCDRCAHGDKCRIAGRCQYYYPVNGMNDRELGEYIERERKQFRKDWEEYVSDREA